MKTYIAILPILALSLTLELKAESPTQNPADTSTQRTNNNDKTTENASLTWNTTYLQKVTSALTTEVPIEFTATNNSTSTITITGIDKSCGCTTIEASSLKIEPNQSTTIKGEIAIPLHGGDFNKTLTVNTDTGTSQVLKINIKSPVTYRLSKSALSWDGDGNREGSLDEYWASKDGNLKGKTVTLDLIQEDLAFKNIKIFSKDFSVETKEINKRKYEFTFFPKNTEISKTAAKLELSQGTNTLSSYITLHYEEKPNLEPKKGETAAAVETIKRKPAEIIGELQTINNLQRIEESKIIELSSKESKLIEELRISNTTPH